MAAGDSTQVIATEIERVSDKLPILFEREDTFFSQIEKRDVEIISERDMRVPLELRPGGKSGHWDPNGGDMGRGDMPTYDKAVINTVHTIHRLEWTTKRKWATDSQRKAIVDTFKRDVASGMAQFRRFQDTLCMTTAGVLGTISAVANAGGVDTYTLGTDGFGAKLMYYGQDLRVFDSTLATDRTAAGERTISFHDIPNKQIKVPQVAGAIAGDKIVASGLSTTPPVSIFGIPYHQSSASTGTWLGFDRATTPEIRANRVNASSSLLTLSMPRLAMNKIGDRLGRGKGMKLMAWTHPAQKAQYEEMGQELVGNFPQPKGSAGLDLYFNQENMRLAGAPLSCSFAWDRTRIDFLDLMSYGRAQFHPVEWYKDDNGNKFFIVRGASGGVAASNLAYIVASWNLFTANPAASAYIDALAVPSGY